MGEEVTGCVDVVLDRVGTNRDFGDGFPLYEQDGVAFKEVILGCWGG